MKPHLPAAGRVLLALPFSAVLGAYLHVVGTDDPAGTGDTGMGDTGAGTTS